MAHLLFGVDTRAVLDLGMADACVSRRFHRPVKPVLFGFIIATIGCYYGMSTRGGTQGVGRLTTRP